MKVVRARWRGSAGVIAALAITATLAAVADAKVVVGQGIAGVRLGDSRATVQHVFGKGRFCSSGNGETSCDYGRALQGRVSFDQQGRVVDLFTGSCKQRTSAGIHPGCGSRKGSSLQNIKKAFPGIKCEVTGGFASCSRFSRYHGRTVSTSFLIKSATFGVAEIEIGYVS
jgi:hypothetical protein